MQSKKTIITAQFFISLMMCFLMTGYASTWVVGFNDGFFGFWFHSFIRAWPVAFLLSMVCGSLGFKIAMRVSPLLFK